MKAAFKQNKSDQVGIINFVHLNRQEKDTVRSWRNNARIRKCFYQDHIISRAEHAGFIKNLRKDNKNFYWLLKCGENMGVISLNRLDYRNKNAYLGIYANPGSKLPGVGSMLMEVLKKIAFGVFNLHTLKLEVIASNRRAIRFYLKNGFKEEGRLKDFVYRNNKWHDVIVMGLINKKRSNG